MKRQPSTDKIQEKAKFKRFYLAFSVVWGVMVVFFVLGSAWSVNRPSEQGGDFLDPMLNVTLVFFVIGIPIIFLLSVPLIFAEKIMDRIKEKIDARNEENA